MFIIKKDYLLYLVAHRINLGDPVGCLNNNVDNSREALEVLLDINRFAPDLENLKGFECDIRLTKDKQLVVVHEGNIKTITADKIDRNISDLTYAELQNIYVNDIRNYYHGLMARSYLFPDSKRIRKVIHEKLIGKTIVPKAFEMFEYLATVGYAGEILLELKELSDNCTQATTELINAYKDRLNIKIQSYDSLRVLKIGNATGVKMGVLQDIIMKHQKDDITPQYIQDMPFDFYSMVWPRINEKRLQAITENNKDLYTWTIDSPYHVYAVLDRLENFYDKHEVIPQNVHLITNIPILVNEYLKQGDKNNSRMIRSIHEKYQKLFNNENYRQEKRSSLLK